MGDMYKKAKSVFEKELEKIVSKDSLTPSELEVSYKLVDIIKDICEICEKEESEYDKEYSGARYGMRRSMGYPAYAENYGRGYSGSYGMNTSKNSSIHTKLQKMMDEAGSDQERMMIQSWMNDLMN